MDWPKLRGLPARSSRCGNDWTRRFKKIANDAHLLNAGSAIDMQKRDWTFVTLCLAGAILAAVGSIKVAMGYRAHRAASDFSSSHRPRYPLDMARPTRSWGRFGFGSLPRPGLFCGMSRI